jgi:hypothetical protein
MVDKSSTRYEVSELDACEIFASYKAVRRVLLKKSSVDSVGSLELVLGVEGDVWCFLFFPEGSSNIELHWDAGVVEDEPLFDWLAELPVFSIWTVRGMLFCFLYCIHKVLTRVKGRRGLPRQSPDWRGKAFTTLGPYDRRLPGPIN